MPSGILVPQPGIEPVPPAVEVRSPNHWTARESREEIWVEVRGWAKGRLNLAHLKNSNIIESKVEVIGQKGDNHKKAIF